MSPPNVPMNGRRITTVVAFLARPTVFAMSLGLHSAHFPVLVDTSASPLTDRRALLSLLLCTVLFYAMAPVAAQAQVPELTGRVVDNANLLSPTTESVLASQLKTHEDSTGNQVAVLTVESLRGEVLEDFSLEVARTWELGTSEFDNGVLLLIAEQERQMRIEVGYGLEGALPDATADQIIRYEMRPRFREGDFDGGVRAGTSAIISSIEGEYQAPVSTSSDGVPTRVIGIFVTIMGAVFGLLPAYMLLAGTAKNGIGCLIIGIIFGGFIPLVGTGAFFVGLGMMLFGESVAMMIIPVIFIPVTVVAFIWHLVLIIRSDEVEEMRGKFKEGETITRGVKVGWLYLPPSMWTQAQITSGTSGGFSSSSGGFSSGGFSSGGGFSGGGGSFGGGGASGGW